MINIKLKYTNIKYPDKVFTDINEFFENENAGVDDVEALKSHVSNHDLYENANEKILLGDKKSVVITRYFESEEMAAKWVEEGNKLPTIDKNLKEEVI